ncbi:MAG: Hsp20/alpha crystallin family protein [Akkermansiaceae bacterium]|nr:Hsp20/alpha crystallin family protein [Akkermansiaceae bacterium]
MSTELLKSASPKTAGETIHESYVQPRFRTLPGKESYTMEILMPGVSKDGLDISLVNDSLTVVGRRRHHPKEGSRPLMVELGDHDYRLRARLNIRVDHDRTEAHMEEGVLTLTLPIHSEAKPRRIEVN